MWSIIIIFNLLMQINHVVIQLSTILLSPWIVALITWNAILIYSDHKFPNITFRSFHFFTPKSKTKHGTIIKTEIYLHNDYTTSTYYNATPIYCQLQQTLKIVIQVAKSSICDQSQTLAFFLPPLPLQWNQEASEGALWREFCWQAVRGRGSTP